MFRSFAGIICLLGVIAPLGAAEKPELSWVIRVTSLKALRADALWIDTLARGPEEAKAYDAEITKNFGKNHAGLDIDRPAGIYGYSNPANFFEFVLVLPLADKKAFIDKMGDWFGRATEDEKDKGLYHSPGGWFTPRIFRVTDRQAYLTWTNPDLLARDKLLDPDKVLVTDLPATLSAVVYMDRMPDALKAMALERVNAMIQKAGVRMPGESELQHTLRSKVMENAAGWLKDAAKDGERIEFQMGVDRKADEFFLQTDVRAKSGTKLATGIDRLGQSKSRFAGRPRGGEAFGLQLRWDLPEDLKPVVRPVVDEAIRRAMQHAAGETVREHATKLTKALAPTLEPGELDATFSLLGPAAGTKHYTLLAAFKVREGKPLDAAVRALVKSLPERERDKFRFDTTTVKGASIHRADIQYDFEDLIAPLCGKHPAYFTITEDSAWLALGPEAQATLKQAIAAPGGAVSVLTYDVSFARLLPLASPPNLTSMQKEAVQKAADRLIKKNDGSDRLRFTLEGGKSLRGRLSVKSGALEMIRYTTPDQSWPLAWLFR
jgi:hypothetical protein